MNNNTKKIVLGILVVAVIGMTIAYAALSQTLNINSTTSVKGSTWDIHLTNVQTPRTTGKAKGDNISSNSKNMSLTINNIEVIEPGDSITYEFDVINEGSIDAVVASKTESIKTCSAGATDVSKYCDKIDYSLVYKATGEKLQENDELAAGESKTLNLIVTYDKNKTLTDLPKVDITVSGLTETINYGQISKEIPTVLPKVCSITEGTGTNVGDMITCGTESFYVIKNDGNTIDMLSQYNVNTNTNLQSTSANYIKFGNNNSYNTSSIINSVNKYSNYLKNTLGVESASGRLIKRAELLDTSIGCSSSSCSSAPSFIYSTSYWTSTGYGKYNNWYVSSDSTLTYCAYDSAKWCGLRPVITISVDEI